MKQIEVTILGQSYILGCPDGGESALLEAVADVDREMSAIRDGGKVKARERIAVLAALNLAFALAATACGGARRRCAPERRRPGARRRRRAHPPHRHDPQRGRTTALIHALSALCAV